MGSAIRLVPRDMQINPPLESTLGNLSPLEGKAMPLMARWKVLPESWLYGLADVRSVANTWPSYIFGKVYAHGVWFYFPVAFVIKATLTTLIFLPLIVYAIATRKLRGWREILFLSSATVALLLHLHDFEAEHRHAYISCWSSSSTRPGRRGRVEPDLQGIGAGHGHWRPDSLPCDFVVASVPDLVHRLCQ